MDSRFDTLESRISGLQLASSSSAEQTRLLLGERIASETQKAAAMLMEYCPSNSLAQSMALSIQKTVAGTIEEVINDQLPTDGEQKPSVQEKDSTNLPERLPRALVTKYYNTIFGIVKVLAPGPGQGLQNSQYSSLQSQNSQSDEAIEHEIVIVPRRWISTSALRLLLKWDHAAHWGSFHFRWRQYVTVSDSSPIISACWHGNVAEIQNLVRQGLPVQQIMDSQGQNLVTASFISHGLRLKLQCLLESQVTVRNCDGLHNLVKTCELLLQLGCEADGGKWALITRSTRRPCEGAIV